MHAPLTPQNLIEQILQIQRMEHGSLSIIGQGPNGPYYNLNSWEDGKNRCRYLPQDKVPQVQQAIEAYHHYQHLTEQYAQQIIKQTRAQLNIGVKKSPNPTRGDPTPNPPRPRSGNPASDGPFPGRQAQRRGRPATGGPGAHRPFPVSQPSGRLSVAASRRPPRCRLPAQTRLAAQGTSAAHGRLHLRILPAGTRLLLSSGQAAGALPGRCGLGARGGLHARSGAVGVLGGGRRSQLPKGPGAHERDRRH